MKLRELIDQIQKLNDGKEDVKLGNLIKSATDLLEEIENLSMTNEEKVKIQERISHILENVQDQRDLKQRLKKLKKSLSGEFEFVPSNYYLTLGIGVGLALGTALGISFGVPFDNGIVFGPMIGSGIGLIGGLIVGVYLDKNKESENRMLRNL